MRPMSEFRNNTNVGVRCGWRTCYMGSGLAGMGACIAGMWWHSACPEYVDEFEQELANCEAEINRLTIEQPEGWQEQCRRVQAAIEGILEREREG